MDSSTPDNPSRSQLLTSSGFQEALALLLQGSQYAQLTSGDAWEFAVDIQELRRHGLADNDVRFLIRLKYVQHAREVTKAHCNSRQFRRNGELTFSERSCFILTATGIGAAACYRAERQPDFRHRLSVVSHADDEPIGRVPTGPSWNAEHRILTFQGQVVKRLSRPAVNQELVLSAFEEEHWPLRIDDPLAPHPMQSVKRRLADTIRCLNLGQERPLIHFHGDGTGEGVVWKCVG